MQLASDRFEERYFTVFQDNSQPALPLHPQQVNVEQYAFERS